MVHRSVLLQQTRAAACVFLGREGCWGGNACCAVPSPCLRRAALRALHQGPRRREMTGAQQEGKPRHCEGRETRGCLVPKGNNKSARKTRVVEKNQAGGLCGASSASTLASPGLLGRAAWRYSPTRPGSCVPEGRGAAGFPRLATTSPSRQQTGSLGGEPDLSQQPPESQRYQGNVGVLPSVGRS